ncbi:MAG TPA: hypothetical protein VD835_14600, partial [Pyrinomonadaceae bacterium]|nr:hypothetical protein [Pyrinomonadaceae bacterium]
MTETKGKEKAEIKTRQPQKKTPDTFANLRKPHPVEELLGLTQPTSYTSPAAVTPPTSLTPPTAVTPPTAAPSRDFAKVANSIVREAVPAGAFSGKSKQLYDYLYAKTRGAIVPKRSVRMTKTAIMKGSHIGSERTMYKNLRRLEAAGLVQVRSIAGEQGGSEYSVLLPEEVTPLTPPTHTTHTSHTDHKVVTPVTAESGVSGVSLSTEDSTVSSDPKTSFKTKEEKFDDEATRRLAEAFLQVEKELTGKNSANAVQWEELAEVLITELRIAAGRTTISSVPAFLSEHLRRRLWKVDKKRATEIAAVEPEQGSQPALSDEEKRSCPDCAGTNFWYPE